jgi:hypothetical protein
MPRAITSFLTEVKGEEHFVREGEMLPPNHPVVKARPELFEPESRPARRSPKPPGRKSGVSGRFAGSLVECFAPPAASSNRGVSRRRLVDFRAKRATMRSTGRRTRSTFS